MGTAVEAAVDVITALWRVDKWKNFIMRNDQFYYRFLYGIQELFDRQMREVLENVNTYSKGINRAAGDELYDVNHWDLVFEEFGQLLLPEIIQDRAQSEMMQLLIGVRFDVNNPRVIKFLAEKDMIIKKINATTTDELKKQMIEGVKAGESIPELKRRVTAVFDHAKGYRAERIARTEVIGASNFGAFESYVQSGVVEKKEWLATKDDRVRAEHAAIDGDSVALDKEFSNGLQYPGDPAGSPEQIINCRCTVLPVVSK